MGKCPRNALFSSCLKHLNNPYKKILYPTSLAYIRGSSALKWEYPTLQWHSVFWNSCIEISCLLDVEATQWQDQVVEKQNVRWEFDTKCSNEFIMEGNCLGKEKIQPRQYSNQVYSWPCTQEYVSCPEAATGSITGSWAEIVEDCWVALEVETSSKHPGAALGQEQLSEHSSSLFWSVTEGQKAFPKISHLVPRKGHEAREAVTRTRCRALRNWSLLVSL